MKVSVDPAKCTGHARCWAIDPTFFVLDDDGNADVGVDREVPADKVGAVREAVAACPENALSISE